MQGHKGVCFWVDVHGETMVTGGQDGSIKVYRHIGPSEEVNEEVNGEVNGNGIRSHSKTPNQGMLQGELPIRQEDVRLEEALS